MEGVFVVSLYGYTLDTNFPCHTSAVVKINRKQRAVLDRCLAGVDCPVVCLRGSCQHQHDGG